MMKQSSSTFTILILLCCCSFHFIDQVTSQLVLPQSELTSAIFMIRQYGLKIQENQAAICGGATSNYTFFCTNSTNGYHITKIDVKGDTFTTGLGVPDPTFISYNLPELTEFRTFTIQVKNTSFVFAKLIQNLSKLETLIAEVEATFVVIPYGFPNPQQYPNLKHFEYWCNSPNNPIDLNLFLASTSIVEKIQLTCTGFNFKIDESIYLPNLKYFGLYTRDVNSTTITISESSFPALKAYTILSRFVDIKFSNPNPKTIENLDLMQHNITLIDGSITDYTNLKTLRLGEYNFKGPFPFTSYPSQLTSIILQQNIPISVIPNITLPPLLDSFTSSFDNAKGQVPWNLFSSKKKLYLDLSYNPLLTGSVSPDMCSVDLSLNILNSGITTLPECLYCYLSDPKVIKTTITPPPNFNCNFTIDSLDIYTKFGKALISGTNLGYGEKNFTRYSIKRIVPNSLIEFTTDYLSGPKKTMVIKLSDYYSYTFPLQVIEIAITMADTQSTLVEGGALLNITFEYFNSAVVHTVMVDNTIPCQIVSMQTKYLLCQTFDYIPWNDKNITVSNQYYSTSSMFTFSSPVYPSITAINISNDYKNLTIYGEFGEMGQLNATVRINNTLDCNITSSTREMINCSLVDTPSLGLANINVSLDNLTFYADSLLYFPVIPTTTTPPSVPQTKEQCEESTSKCFGHGICQDNGQCQCNPNYNQFDNCLTKFINTTIKNTSRQPIIEYNLTRLNGDDELVSYGAFKFGLVSIQELNFDNSVLRELKLQEDQWTSDSSSSSYTYTTTTNSSVSGFGNTTIIANTTFSQQPSTDSNYLGNHSLLLNPSSTKLSVSIIDWPYLSPMSTLQIIYQQLSSSEEQSPSQTIDRGCDKVTVSLTKTDEFGVSVQYVQVVNQRAQFNGRFIDYSISNGLETYSRVVQQQDGGSGSSGNSIFSLAVKLPHCQLCQTSFDFTPLEIDQVSCGSETSSVAWKAGVGVAVPVAAILVGAAGFFGRKHIQRKLANTRSKSIELN
ncbi:hypothetical protein DFA_06512 [Cavenderia fasciculata]|uniref:EGF-like domain-containing protein n=1 Tax=Cavenderia fasciculata TaxID=261658 RepID=F4PJ76_CACFS|nr:uncharacterized protein DFA_06512 [Cavenderia fasciculata]EGG24362.1 hypothetical protein DFA_06512 [Cavenderia fasciculata]|eukprot:XP_004362213.1 hypothetical protein DFA_06512 [Cavenderia fasciculata]